MTTASSLLAVATLPLNLFIYLRLAYPRDRDDGGGVSPSVTLDWGALFASLAVILVGVVLGLFAGARVGPATRAKLGAAGNVAGVALILLGFFFSSRSTAPVWARDWPFYLGVSLPCVFGLFVSLAFAKACGLPKPHSLSVTIETCYQNTAIPLAVILSSFSNRDGAVRSRGAGRRGGVADGTCDVVGVAAGVPTFYQVTQVTCLAIVCVVGWKAGWTYAPPNHALYRVLSRNYQPATADEDVRADVVGHRPRPAEEEGEEGGEGGEGKEGGEEAAAEEAAAEEAAAEEAAAAGRRRRASASGRRDRVGDGSRGGGRQGRDAVEEMR